MASRSSYARTSKRIIDDDFDAAMPTSLEETKEMESDTIRLVLLKSVQLTIVGGVTGNKYFFGGAGSVQNVDKRDAEIMLKKRSGNCCPGGIGATPYFEIER